MYTVFQTTHAFMITIWWNTTPFFTFSDTICAQAHISSYNWILTSVLNMYYILNCILCYDIMLYCIIWDSRSVFCKLLKLIWERLYFPFIWNFFVLSRLSMDVSCHCVQHFYCFGWNLKLNHNHWCCSYSKHFRKYMCLWVWFGPFITMLRMPRTDNKGGRVAFCCGETSRCRKRLLQQQPKKKKRRVAPYAKLGLWLCYILTFCSFINIIKKRYLQLLRDRCPPVWVWKTTKKGRGVKKEDLSVLFCLTNIFSFSATART